MTSERDDFPGQHSDEPMLQASAAAPAVIAEPPARASRARRQSADDTERADTGTTLQESLPGIDLRSSEFYLNRELTWLEFNRRVLHEARDPRTPLLERVKFLAIVNCNLDEFFMKRIGGLKQQVGAGVHTLTVDGRTPDQQIAECVGVISELAATLRETFVELEGALREHGIELLAWEQLSDEQRETARTYYLDNIFPLVTPLAMDPAHPFPFISNLSLNLLVTLRHQDDQQPVFARVKVPVGKGVPRFLRVGEGHAFVPLEEVMAHNLDLLFPGMEVEACEFFRVTRNANTERDEEDADDLVSMIEAELRERKFAPIVRLEVGAGIDLGPPRHARGRARPRRKPDVFEIAGLLGLRDLIEIATLDMPELHDPLHHPVTHATLEDPRNIFHVIRETGPILVHHPYESFATSVERFVARRAEDPKVLAIKMTLYRTSADTGIIDAPGRRRAQRQAGRGRGRAQGALRRGRQHPVGQPAGRAPASTSCTAWSASRRTRRSCWSCATTTPGCGATPTSAPATTTPAPRGSTPTSACSPATTRSATT